MLRGLICLLMGHKYKKVLRGSLDTEFKRWMASEEESLKVVGRNGLFLAYDEVCERCGDIEGFKESLK